MQTPYRAQKQVEELLQYFCTNRNCKGYCGVACVDGTCPKANREEYAERGYDLVNNCNECHYNNGCEDCYFNGTYMCILCVQ